jgi:hypothetical protein
MHKQIFVDPSGESGFRIGGGPCALESSNVLPAIVTDLLR